MKHTIIVTLLCVLYYAVPFITSTVCLSGVITVLLIFGVDIFKSVVGLFFIPFLFVASLWALWHTFILIREMCELNLVSE